MARTLGISDKCVCVRFEGGGSNLGSTMEFTIIKINKCQCVCVCVCVCVCEIECLSVLGSVNYIIVPILNVGPNT